MARHRSPEGRRAHLELPLSTSPATAGAGGGYRTVAYQQRSTPSETGLSALAQSMPARFIATAVAGTAIAATGQHLLVQAVPMASDGAAALRAGMYELLGETPVQPAATSDVPSDVPVLRPTFQPISAATAAPLTAQLVGEQAGTFAPVGSDAQVVDAASLVKAADLQRIAAEAEARAAEEARRAEEARAQAEAQARAEDGIRQAGVGNSVGGAVGLFIEGTFTSGFGIRDGSAHKGVDVAAPIGTPIRASMDGTVIDSGPASGFGLWIRIQQEDGTVTTYGHIDATFVEVGQKVAAGDLIANSGNRGRSTGPHLHFEVDDPNGNKINPRPWLAELGVEL